MIYFIALKLLYFIHISRTFVTKDPIDNKPIMVQIMAMHRTGNKSLSETKA